MEKAEFDEKMQLARVFGKQAESLSEVLDRLKSCGAYDHREAALLLCDALLLDDQYEVVEAYIEATGREDFWFG